MIIDEEVEEVQETVTEETWNVEIRVQIRTK